MGKIKKELVTRIVSLFIAIILLFSDTAYSTVCNLRPNHGFVADKKNETAKRFAEVSHVFSFSFEDLLAALKEEGKEPENEIYAYFASELKKATQEVPNLDKDIVEAMRYSTEDARLFRYQEKGMMAHIFVITAFTRLWHVLKKPSKLTFQCTQYDVDVFMQRLTTEPDFRSTFLEGLRFGDQTTYDYRIEGSKEIVLALLEAIESGRLDRRLDMAVVVGIGGGSLRDNLPGYTARILASAVSSKYLPVLGVDIAVSQIQERVRKDERGDPPYRQDNLYYLKANLFDDWRRFLIGKDLFGKELPKPTKDDVIIVTCAKLFGAWIKPQHIEDFKDRLKEIGNDIILIINEEEGYILKNKKWRVLYVSNPYLLDNIIALLTGQNGISDRLGKFSHQNDL